MAIHYRGYVDGTTPNVVWLDQEQKPQQVENVKSTPQQNEGVDEIMNKIYKRKDGRYQIRKQINGFKIDIIDKSKQALIFKYRAKISAYKKATKNANIVLFNQDKKTPSKKLSDWLWEYYELYKKPFMSVDSAKNLKRYFEFVDSQELAQMEIENITEKDLQAFVNSMPYSRNKELIILYLRAALKKYLKCDLFEDVVLERKYKVVRKPFSYQEQQTLWNNLDKFKYKNLIILFLFTGIRKNELPKNFDNILIEHNHLIKIQCEKKRNAAEPIYRYVDLSPKMFNFILKNKDSFNLSTDKLALRFREFLRDLNIKGSLHTLRHTFTHNYYTLGVNLKMLSNWLGHEKTETTIENYVAIDRTITKENLKNLYADWLLLDN